MHWQVRAPCEPWRHILWCKRRGGWARDAIGRRVGRGDEGCDAHDADIIVVLIWRCGDDAAVADTVRQEHEAAGRQSDLSDEGGVADVLRKNSIDEAAPDASKGAPHEEPLELLRPIAWSQAPLRVDAVERFGAAQDLIRICFVILTAQRK